MKLSLTYSGIVVSLLSQLVPEITTSDLDAFLRVLLALVGAGIAFYGRYRIGNVKWFGVKK